MAVLCISCDKPITSHRWLRAHVWDRGRRRLQATVGLACSLLCAERHDALRASLGREAIVAWVLCGPGTRGVMGRHGMPRPGGAA